MTAVRHEWGLLSSEIVWDGELPPSTKIYPVGYTCQGCNEYFMAHTLEEKKKLLNRVRRIRGQVDSIERALDQEAECSDVLHNISACRGAMDALMAEVIEGHIRFHVLDPNTPPTDDQAQAADDLIHALRAYLK
jgi:DNA-binding FrmR family transcriptional regulator